MNHVKIWSLKRGRIDPPEPLDYSQEIRIFSENPETRHIQWERDPPMGQKERLIEEGRRRRPRKLARR